VALLESRQSSSTPTVSHAYAEAISQMAEAIYAKGNLLKARNVFERAHKTLPDDRKGEARIHLFAAYIAGTTGRPEKAISEASQALTLYQATGDKDGEGLALTALGLSYSFKRNEDKAIKLHHQAIEIFRSIGDHHSEAIVFIALGQAYENLGDYLAALKNYENAFSLFESDGALDFTVGALYKIGTVHRLKNNLDQALTYYQRSLSLSRTARMTRLEALVLEGIALIYDAQGRSEAAVKEYRTVQKFYEASGDVRGQAVALNNYGDFLLKLGQKQEALAIYNRALPLSEQVGDTGTLLTTLHNLSRAHLSLGSYEAALSVIKDSIKIIEKLRENVGSPELRALYFAVVKKHYDLWIDILMQFHRARPREGHDVKALLVSDRSRARSLIDLLSEPRADLSQGASSELLERERELRGLISVQAQYQMELSLNPKNSAEVAEIENETNDLRAEYQQIQAALREQNPKVASLRSFEPTSLEQIQNELRDSDTMLLQYALGDERSYLWAITANSVQSYELSGRRSIETTAHELYSLLTMRQAPIETIKGDYQAFVEAADDALTEKASKLSQMLLAPLAHQLGNRKLIIVTEGTLQAIPFEALPAPHVQFVGPTNWETFVDSLLINTNEISSLPSISTLLAIRSEKNRPSSPYRTVAVIADPVFSRNDDRVRFAPMTSLSAGAASDKHVSGFAERGLPSVAHGSSPARLTYSSAEADAISAAAPRGTTMIATGFAANRETVMSSRVGEYQILHFATHGFLDIEHPELSGIVLTMVDPKGVSQNGLMPLHDIYSLDLSAELTVLSACQTALGKDIGGEGFLGLPHSFMSAGSKSVVASLWKVDDRATANLMTDFYESLLQHGMTTGSALRMAKLKTMQQKQWRAPYFWAGFVLQGEYTNRIAVDNQWWLHPGRVFLALFLLLSSGVIAFRLSRHWSARC
jgi:CHAT domain-containing protein/Tfp pilus assembly protein PilF